MRFRIPRKKGKLGLFGGLTAALGLVALVSVGMALAVPPTTFNPDGVYSSIAGTDLNADHVGAVGSEFKQSENCEADRALFEVGEGETLWHFILTSPASDSGVLRADFLSAGLTEPDDTDYPTPAEALHWWIVTPGDDTLLNASTDVDGGNLNLSHVCPGVPVEEDEEHLTVTKTVDTTYDREHFWSIDKKVETDNDLIHNELPKIWLYTDGSGDETATWTIDVTYDGFEDSGHNVSGTVKVVNDGDLPAEVSSVDDELAGTPIDLECDTELPATLGVGEEINCTYSEDGFVEGTNVASATTAIATYSSDAVAITWGAPANETNNVVNVKDIGELPSPLDEQDFGPIDASTCTEDEVCATFDYEMEFSWEDYGQAGCGDHQYDNTATITETDDSASATLLVNVQCFIFETAYAKGTTNPRCFTADRFSQWGWTNPVTKPAAGYTNTYTWNLYAGAAMCDITKGTLVGTVTVNVASNGAVTYTYNIASGYAVQETHFYSGCNKYPKQGTKDTVAPGQYTNGGLATCANGYVIAHAVVGIPDPNFGPA